MTPTPSASDVLRDELPWLRAFAQRLASPSEVDDLVQETWIAAWQHPPTSESTGPGGRALRPWLARVLRNRAHNRRRAETRRQARDAAAELEPVAAADPDAELRRLDVLKVLVGLLADLPETDRRIVIRRFADEQNATEIGQALDLPPATVRSRLRRALARLREELDTHHGGRAAWAGVLMPWPGARVPLAVGTKVGVAIAITAVAGGVAIAASRSEPPAPSAVAAAPATSVVDPDRPAPADDTVAARRTWQALTREIRAANAAAPGPDVDVDVDVAAIAPALEATAQLQQEVFSMCVADLGLHSGESMTIVSDVIGAPGLGTVVTDARIDGDVAARDELLECLTESMYTLRGPAPEAAIATEMSFQFGTAAPGIPHPPPLPEASELDAEQRATVDAHHRTLSPGLAACDETGATGSATLRVTLDAEGAVTSARFVETTLDLGVVDCMAEHMIAHWRFEGLPEGTVLELHETLPAAPH